MSRKGKSVESENRCVLPRATGMGNEEGLLFDKMCFNGYYKCGCLLNFLFIVKLYMYTYIYMR